jgi:hypothetical protein
MKGRHGGGQKTPENMRAGARGRVEFVLLNGPESVNNYSVGSGCRPEEVRHAS